MKSDINGRVIVKDDICVVHSDNDFENGMLVVVYSVALGLYFPFNCEDGEENPMPYQGAELEVIDHQNGILLDEDPK